MISHRNIRAMTDSVMPTLKVTRDDVSVSYLPLSHVAEQLLSIHSPMKVGGQLYFAESLEKLPEALQEARPTVLFGVPRVWEKIQAKMMAAGAAAPPLQKKIAIWAKDIGLRASDAEERGGRPPLLYPIAKKLVFDKVRKRLGFDRLRICATGAAPTSRATLDFFRSLGIPLFEVYGMSECTGAATFSTPEHHRFGKCGRVIPGGEIKIAEDGEICIRGEHVFKGYLKDDEATQNAVDADGYLHSGDIGTIDADGYLQVTDRKKDLLITAGGENIAPQPIEGHLQAISGVAQAVVVGDRMKYLAALLVLDPERLPAAIVAAGSDAKNAAEAAECQIFRRHIEQQINVVNQKLARVQTIKKFVVLPAEFSVDTGELTPTMKVKRKVVNTKYERQIASMYSDADSV
jgi:long-subunit acyl-CoA synthetase (AMP-forming)